MGRIKKCGQRKGHGNQHENKKCSVNNAYMRNSDSQANRRKVSESDIGEKKCKYFSYSNFKQFT
jgi:hypothetical protein